MNHPVKEIAKGIRCRRLGDFLYLHGHLIDFPYILTVRNMPVDGYCDLTTLSGEHIRYLRIHEVVQRYMDGEASDEELATYFKSLKE